MLKHSTFYYACLFLKQTFRVLPFTEIQQLVIVKRKTTKKKTHRCWKIFPGLRCKLFISHCFKCDFWQQRRRYFAHSQLHRDHLDRGRPASRPHVLENNILTKSSTFPSFALIIFLSKETKKRVRQKRCVLSYFLCARRSLLQTNPHTHTHTHLCYLKAMCHCPVEAVSRNSSFHVSSPVTGLVTRPRPASSQTQSGSCCIHHQSKDNLLPIRKKKKKKSKILRRLRFF